MFLLIIQLNWGDHEGNEAILGDGVAGRMGGTPFTNLAEVVGVSAYDLN